MCAVSNMGDMWRQDHYPSYPSIPIVPTTPVQRIVLGSEVTKAEFDALKREVAALKELLIAAKKYDEATGQPDCEMDDKVALIRKVAELVGVDFSDVFDTTPRSAP